MATPVMNADETRRQSDELWQTEKQIAKLRERIQLMKQEVKGKFGFS